MSGPNRSADDDVVQAVLAGRLREVDAKRRTALLDAIRIGRGSSCPRLAGPSSSTARDFAPDARSRASRLLPQSELQSRIERLEIIWTNADMLQP